MENIMHGNLEPEESVWSTEPNTYTVHPEMAGVDLDSEELLSVNFETKPDVDVVFTVDPSFQKKINEYFTEEEDDDDDGDIVVRL
tara:strand:- start:3 stop:257 length:255 start_codon:yes stop_codon:yes gene_type:complete